MKSLITALILLITISTPSFASDYYESGSIELKKGNYAKANEFFQYELEENPENLKCRYLYAQSLIGINNAAKAQKEYEKVIEQAPNSDLAKLSSVAIFRIQEYYLEKNQKTTSQNPSSLSFGDNYITNAQYNGKIVHWNLSRMPLKVYIDSSYGNAYYSTVKNALSTWISALGTKAISFSMVNSSKNADISVTFASEIGKQTGKTYMSGLATPSIKGYMLESCTVKLKTTDSNNASLSQEEIFQTAVHELGHAFGIWGHSPKETDIMYDSSTANSQNSVKKLSERDINTLKLLYWLDADISNFGVGEKPVTNSEKNNSVLGNSSQRLSKKLQEAVDYVKKYPNNAISWSSLGNVYFDTKEYSNAITCYQKSLEIDNSFTAARSGLALSYDKTGDFNNAYKQFATLVAQEPQNIGYSHNLALFLINNKKYNEASGVLNSLIKANPDAAKDSNIQNLINSLKTTQ